MPASHFSSPDYLPQREILVGAGCVLARPLVQLLTGSATGAEDIQAQTAVLIAELVRAIRLRHRLPQGVRCRVRTLLHDVRTALRGRVVGHRDVLTRVLRLQFAVAA